MVFRRSSSRVMSPFWALALAFSVIFAPVALAQEQAEQPAEEEPPVVVSSPSLETSLGTSLGNDEQAETAEDADATLVIDQPDTPSNAFVVYLMRHAEKEDSHIDPELTRDGYRRADGLAQMLSNAGIEAIYSTYYRRSVGTALPLARELSVPVQFYQAENADALLDTVQSQRLNALIIGHSNTVPDILARLGIDYPEMSEQEYGDLFQLFVPAAEQNGSQSEAEVEYIHLTAPLIMNAR